MVMTFLTPRSLASREQAITQVCFGFRERHNPDRAPPQMRARLLFDGGEEAVEIEVQPFDVCRPAHAKGSRERKRD
jgi:hypothetical protein